LLSAFRWAVLLVSSLGTCSTIFSFLLEIYIFWLFSICFLPDYNLFSDQFLGTNLMAASSALCQGPACDETDCGVAASVALCNNPACDHTDCAAAAACNTAECLSIDIGKYDKHYSGWVLTIRRRNSDSEISSDGPPSPFSDTDPRKRDDSLIPQDSLENITGAGHDHSIAEPPQAVSSIGIQQTTDRPHTHTHTHTHAHRDTHTHTRTRTHTHTPQFTGTASDLPAGQTRPNAETEPAAKRPRFLDKPVWQVGIDWTGSSYYVWLI